MRERENKRKTEAEEVLEERKKPEKEGKSKEEGRPVVEGKSESQGKPASEGKPKEGKPAMKPRAAGKHPSGVDAPGKPTKKPTRGWFSASRNAKRPYTICL